MHGKGGRWRSQLACGKVVVAAGTLSKKKSHTKVTKNCMKSLYSQVSVKIFDKVKQSHLSVSQCQLKLGEKSPKKKP